METRSGFHGDGVDLYVQAWYWELGVAPPSRIEERVHESVPAPDPLDHWIRPGGTTNEVDRIVVERAVAQRAQSQAAAVLQAQAEVIAAGLDPEDQDLVEERLYCTCGLGNATEGKVHDPGCGVWS